MKLMDTHVTVLRVSQASTVRQVRIYPKKQLCNSNAGNQRNAPAIRATKASQIQPDIDHYVVDRKQK